MKKLFKHKTTINSRFYYLVIMNVVLMGYASNLFVNRPLSEICIKLAYYLAFNIGFLGLVFIAISLITNKKIQTIIINCLFIFCVFFACIEIFLYMQFHSLMQPLFMDIFLSTNFNETKEFLSFYVNANLLEGGDMSYIPYVIFSFVVISLLFLYIKLPTICFYSIHIFIISGICFGVSVGKYKNSNSLYRFIISLQGAKLQSVNIIVKHNKFLESMKDSIKLMKIALQNNNGGGGGNPPKIIIIVGESTQRGYMGIYGFSLPTTPNLQRLKDSSNLFVFNDIVSPATSTNASLEKVLTMSSYENANTPWYNNFNIIDLAKIANYNTIWISNQGAFGKYDRIATSLINNVDKILFNKYVGLDEEIFPLLDLAMKEEKDKNLYIIHLSGTHWGYNVRYSNKYKVFDEISVSKIQQNSYKLKPIESKNKADYLNAVLYNDFVVSNIMERFKDDNAIVFYFSDHGEEVYEFRSFAGHSISDSRFAAEIPFVIYVSDKYKQLYPNKIELIKKALNKPQMNDDFIYSFLDILDLRIDGVFDSTRSIFSKDYNANRKRLIYGEIDYDKDLKIHNR